MAIRIIEFATGFQTDETPGTGVDASTISVEPVGNLSSTDLQSALEEHQGDIDAANAARAAHIANVSNPHAVTKAQVGLGNADNTSDASKPVSTAQQAALDLKADTSSVTSALATKADATATTAALALKLAKTSDTATDLTIADKISFSESTDPATPAAGKLVIFAKADKKFYQKDSTGAVSILGGGGLTPAYVTALPTTLANGTAYQLAPSASTTGVLPVTTLAATIEINDATGTCNATNFIRITPGTGDKINGYTTADSLVLRRKNVSVRLNKAAGDTTWYVTYQVATVAQPGQLPGITTGTTLPGSIGEKVSATVSTSVGPGASALDTYLDFAGWTTTIPSAGEWRITLSGSIGGVPGGTGFVIYNAAIRDASNNVLAAVSIGTASANATNTMPTGCYGGGSCSVTVVTTGSLVIKGSVRVSVGGTTPTLGSLSLRGDIAPALIEAVRVG